MGLSEDGGMSLNPQPEHYHGYDHYHQEHGDGDMMIFKYMT